MMPGSVIAERSLIPRVRREPAHGPAPHQSVITTMALEGSLHPPAADRWWRRRPRKRLWRHCGRAYGVKRQSRPPATTVASISSGQSSEILPGCPSMVISGCWLRGTPQPPGRYPSPTGRTTHRSRPHPGPAWTRPGGRSDRIDEHEIKPLHRPARPGTHASSVAGLILASSGYPNENPLFGETKVCVRPGMPTAGARDGGGEALGDGLCGLRLAADGRSVQSARKDVDGHEADADHEDRGNGRSRIEVHRCCPPRRPPGTALSSRVDLLEGGQHGAVGHSGRAVLEPGSGGSIEFVLVHAIRSRDVVLIVRASASSAARRVEVA